MEDNNGKIDKVRRRFVRKAVYVAPAVLTLSAMPFSASYGSQPVSDGDPLDNPSKRHRHFGKKNKRHRPPEWADWDRDDE